MTEIDKKKLRTRIVAELEGVVMDIENLREASRPIPPDNAIGRLTRMEAINARGISEAKLRDARIRRTNLERALDRLDSPGFGLCTICEEPIAPGRLLLLPEARCCVACAADDPL